MTKDNGFSLIELVTAVGFLLILIVGCLLTYNSIVEEARSLKDAETSEYVQKNGNSHSGPETNEDRETKSGINR